MNNVNPGDSVVWGGDEDRGGVAPAAPQESAQQQAGNSVTPGLQISGPSQWEILAANVDTLDLSLYVKWGPKWAELFEELEKGKLSAQETGVAIFRGGETIIFSTAGKRFFSWHLQRTEFHLFLARNPEPSAKTPNVSVSFNARTLWEIGPHAAFQLIVDWINQLGGSVHGAHISRLDVAADFVVEGGITYEFIKQHLVTHCENRNVHEAGTATETIYIGALGSPQMLRIYDKTRELAKSPTKTWLREIWGDVGLQTVFRIEFQLRREALRAYGINALEDLNKVGGLWACLTRDWVSIRNLDNENTTRRSVHPFWEAVQAVAKKFGPIKEVKRRKFQSMPDLKNILGQAMGSVKTFAALMKLECTFEEAIVPFVQVVKERSLDESFQEEVKVRRIKLSVPRRNIAESDTSVPEIPNEGDDSPPFIGKAA